MRDLAECSGVPYETQLYENALKDLYRELVGRTPSVEEVRRETPKLRSMLYKAGNKPTNFLKHADRDPCAFLDEEDLKTDDALLEACSLFVAMGFDPTVEMCCFGRWHLAVYPYEDGDTLVTDEGPVHELPRELQLALGQYMLDHWSSASRE